VRYARPTLAKDTIETAARDHRAKNHFSRDELEPVVHTETESFLRSFSWDGPALDPKYRKSGLPWLPGACSILAS
jgi:hypothetical protein